MDTFTETRIYLLLSLLVVLILGLALFWQKKALSTQQKAMVHIDTSLERQKQALSQVDASIELQRLGIKNSEQFAREQAAQLAEIIALLQSIHAKQK